MLNTKEKLSLDFLPTDVYWDSGVSVPIESIYCMFEIDATPTYEEINDKELLRLAQSSAFKFLNDPKEDIYTINDGKPI